MKVSKQSVTKICLENNLSDNEAASKFAEFFESACSPNTQLYCDRQRVKYKAEIANYSGDYLRPDLFDAENVAFSSAAKLVNGKSPGIDGLTSEHVGLTNVILSYTQY